MSQFPRHPFNHWLLRKCHLIPSLDAAALCLPLLCRLEKGYVPLNLESRGNRSCLKWLLRDHFIISEHQLWFQRAKKVSHLKRENYCRWLRKGRHRVYSRTLVALYYRIISFFFLFVWRLSPTLTLYCFLQFYLFLLMFFVQETKGKIWVTQRASRSFNPSTGKQKIRMSFLLKG